MGEIAILTWHELIKVVWLERSAEDSCASTSTNIMEYNPSDKYGREEIVPSNDVSRILYKTIDLHHQAPLRILFSYALVLQSPQLGGGVHNSARLKVD